MIVRCPGCGRRWTLAPADAEDYFEERPFVPGVTVGDFWRFGADAFECTVCRGPVVPEH